MAKKAKSAAAPEPMKLFYIFYNQERWDNWLNRLRESDFEVAGDAEEMPEGFQALYNFGQDITVSILKIIKLYQNGRFPKEETLERLAQVESVIMSPAPEDQIEEIVESLQLTMLALFASCRMFIEGGYPTDIKVLVKEGRKMIDEDMEKALEIAANIGANVINGATCCGKYIKDDIEQPTLFDEWLIEIETMNEAMTTLKNFDEDTGEES